MNWKVNKQKLASAAVMMGAAALTVTTVVLAAGPGGGGGMGGSTGKMDVAEKSTSIIQVNLTSPAREDLIKATEYIGKLEAAGSISVYPETSGKVAELYYEAGQQVNAGDLLMRLDTDDLSFELEVAQASYNEKVISANKALGSDYTSKIISAQNSLDKANRSYRTARQQYATEANVEDDELEKADEKRISAKQAWDDARTVWSKAREDYIAAHEGSSEGVDDDPAVIAAHNAYTEAYEKYQDADNDYYTLTQEYDESTSAVASSKDNAYKDVVQAQESLELATGAAFEDQKAVTEASLISAQLSLQKAERALEKCYVYAPVSGTIESRSATLYETAATNTAAFTIAGDDAVQVAFNVSSSGAAVLTLGDEVTVTQAGVDYPASIVEMEGKADATTGLFPIKASLSGSGGTLLPGVSVKVTATTQREENALTLPIDNIYFDDSQPYVFTYSGGKAHRANLTVGTMSAESAVIIDGITESDYVITTWHPDLKDGATVVLSEQAAALTGESTGTTAAPVADTPAAPNTGEALDANVQSGSRPEKAESESQPEIAASDPATSSDSTPSSSSASVESAFAGSPPAAPDAQTSGQEASDK